ncbi:MAG: BMP family ABC transporter substrate-binding protein [Selenomonadaceae bacterium]|nr:BMP family ABC transporter substrate-binding protein [Selenomonadaceae bacterium]
MKPILGKHTLVFAFCAVALALIAGIFQLLFSIRQQEDDVAVMKRPRIGLVLYGGQDEAGWNRQHATGVLAAARRVGVDVDVVDHVTFETARAEEALARLSEANGGHDFTIATSAEFSPAAEALHDDGSHMDVAVPKLDEKGRSCVPYFVRLYQGEYLAGILAGLETQTGRIGYVASTRNPEVCRSVNAFLLGAQETRPDVEVLVLFVGSWSNPDAERQAAARLVEHGADILNSHQDTMAVQAYADAHGVMYLDYLEPYETSSGLGLATVECRWDMVYESMLRDYLRGRFRSMYWIGIEDDAVGLSNFSPRIDEAVRSRVLAEEARIRENGSVFSGAIYDTDGKLRVADGETLSDAALIHLDWYAEGVVFP